MQRLTKEQADWLSEQIGLLMCVDSNNLGWNDNYQLPVKSIMKIITQCTDVPPPEFSIDLKTSIGRTWVYKIRCNYKDGHIEIVDDDEKYIKLNHEQFKEFAAGCQRVVAWINSHGDSK